MWKPCPIGRCLRHAPAANRRGHSVVHIPPVPKGRGLLLRSKWRSSGRLARHSGWPGGDARRSTAAESSARLRGGGWFGSLSGGGFGRRALTAGSEAQHREDLPRAGGCLTRTTRYFRALRGAFPWRRHEHLAAAEIERDIAITSSGAIPSPHRPSRLRAARSEIADGASCERAEAGADKSGVGA